MVYGIYNYSYWGESKPTYILGASHCSIKPYETLHFEGRYHFDIYFAYLSFQALKQAANGALLLLNQPWNQLQKPSPCMAKGIP